MKRSVTGICLLLVTFALHAQPVAERLRIATSKLLDDSQMKHAILGMSVVKTETGEKIFELNPQTGLAPASCQKTITSAAAMELLGPDYRYKTVLGYTGGIQNGTLNGNLVLTGSGDPSLGSWRYDSTRERAVMNRWARALKAAGIRNIQGNITGNAGSWEAATIPGGWIWDDMGNYYGAGSAALNWRENQYDLLLQSGDIVGSPVKIAAARPAPYDLKISSELLAASKGTGDNAYIYSPPFAHEAVVRGTIPVGEKSFAISGSFPDPAMQTVAALEATADSLRIRHRNISVSNARNNPPFKIIDTYYSPVLDSLNYWFLKKSINLYGEVFLKTMAAEKTGYGSVEGGLKLIRQFWKERGIENSALHILDGSGLSPQNRVTTDALVKVLQYAHGRPWFHYYYDALPMFNQMKLKSGTIGGAKSFAGYHTSKDGTGYTVAIIINNYDGSAGELVKKMYLVLDELK
jgi:D-alanyl-D-alanine carboxypeptidase/D-alanyl-D-alanine-endopeptidase (penicillin-binding protein 4)